MTPSEPEFEALLEEWHNRQVSRLKSSSSLSSQAQEGFLNARKDSLKQLATLTEMEFTAMGAGQPAPKMPTPSRPALFSLDQLDNFARGSIVECLGPAFSVYAGRRSPRIPNGDLLMMSRVISIDGQKRNFDQPAQIIAEFDVPDQGWFIHPEIFANLPNVTWMEMALQPCGFLSAYLETSLTQPDQDFYFRNLDGQARLLVSLDLRGKTVTTYARLVKTTVSNNIIIQLFEFDLRVGATVFYQGYSTFGYFPLSAMLNQAGLDGGKMAPAWIASHQEIQIQSQPIPFPVISGSNGRRLNDLDHLYFVPNAGKYQAGYLYGTKVVRPEDWYFEYHFFEDPVMPGSLGIESVLFALRAYAAQTYGSRFRLPQYTLPVQEPITWKYRGQILRQNRQMELEIHLKNIDLSRSKITLWGDASLWSDRLRIYEMNQIGITLLEG